MASRKVIIPKTRKFYLTLCEGVLASMCVLCVSVQPLVVGCVHVLLHLLKHASDLLGLAKEQSEGPVVVPWLQGHSRIHFLESAGGTGTGWEGHWVGTVDGPEPASCRLDPSWPRTQCRSPGDCLLGASFSS